MKKTAFCKRLLTIVLALAILISAVPMGAMAATGDFGGFYDTGLVDGINVQDSINWPIKIYDYLNDGMLFEYSSGSHQYATVSQGAAYGGGTIMPSQSVIGNDYTVNGGYITTSGGHSAVTDAYDDNAFKNWFQLSQYNKSAAQGGVGTKGAMKYLHLSLSSAISNPRPVVLTDFIVDNDGSVAETSVQYAVVVYRTNVSGGKIDLGWSHQGTGKETYAGGVSGTSWDYSSMDYSMRGPEAATADGQWHSLVVNMKTGTGDLPNDSTNGKISLVLLDVVGLDTTSEYFDISHIAYFDSQAKADNYASDALNFVNNPGEYLLDQNYTSEVTTTLEKPAGTGNVINFPDNAAHFSDSPYTGWGSYASRVDNGDKDYASLSMSVSSNSTYSGWSGGANSAYFAYGIYASRASVRYVTIVYRTHSLPTNATIGFWVEGTDSSGSGYAAGAGSGRNYATMVTLPQSTTEWIYFTYDLNCINIKDTDYSNVMAYITKIGAFLPSSGSMDIAYVDYHQYLDDAHSFGEDAANYMNGNYTVNPAPSPSAYGIDFVKDVYESSAISKMSASQDNYTTALDVRDIDSANRGYVNIYDVDNDNKYDATYFLSGVSLPKANVRYLTIVYRTHNLSGVNKIGFWVNGTTSSGSTWAAGKDTSRTSSYVNLTTLNQSETKWVYQTFDLQTLINAKDTDYTNYISKVTDIGVYLPGFTNCSQSMDIAYIDYYSSKSAADTFGATAALYMNSGGSTSASGGSTYYKHWNMGGNTAFTMIFPSTGGGWEISDGQRGGSNTWTNGYYSYNIGQYLEDSGWSELNSQRTTAASLGYPVSGSIFTLQNNNYDVSTLDLGYVLKNTAVSGIYTAGLLESGLLNVNVGGTNYKTLQYKDDTIDYIALLLENTLKIPQTDSYGNYNYTFVQGADSSQFAYTWNGTEVVAGVDGESSVTLAAALRKRLGIVFDSTDYAGGRILNDTNIVPRSTAAALSAEKRAALVGPFRDCVGEIDSFAAAAYYLLHNLFIDNSYNQLQNDYKYLVLSKGTLHNNTTSNTSDDREAFVFDAGFTTGQAGLTYDSSTGTFTNASGKVVYSSVEAYLQDSQRAVQYDTAAGTISLISGDSKDNIYSGANKTTRFPFLPVTDAEGDYAGETVTYFAEDQSASVMPEGEGYANRNFNYVLQANGEFIYQYGDDLFFNFAGDDDVYLFINDELVLDIGAAHAITTVNMNMNDYVLEAQQILAPLAAYGYVAGMPEEDFAAVLTAAKAAGATDSTISDAQYLRWHRLNLVDGQSYPIDFYYMERHGWGANMRIATNIVMTDPALGCEKSAYQDGAEIAYGGIVDKAAPIEYSFALTNNGNSKLYNLTFTDYDIGVALDPTNGLTVTGSRATGAGGAKLQASDLVAYVTGWTDDTLTTPTDTIVVTFKDTVDDTGAVVASANDYLKQFLHNLTGEGLGAGDSTNVDYSGAGLWKHSTVTIRGIYYTMSAAQQSANEFTNTVFVSATPAPESTTVIKSESKHQVRSIANAIHFYQWANNPVHLTRSVFRSAAGITTAAEKFLMVTSTPSASNASLYIDYAYNGVSYADGYKRLEIKYTTPGTYLLYVKAMADSNANGTPDVREDDDSANNNSYLQIVPVIVHVTDVADSTVVLDYGLKADLMDEGGILANDSVGVANISTTVTAMGICATEPGYLKDYSAEADTLGNINRITMTPDADGSIGLDDGTYAVEDGRLTFTPTDFMDASYDVWAAITVHNTGKTPSSVGPANASARTYTIDITNEVQMYQKVTVLPANVVYYEDDFAGMTYTAPAGSFTKHGAGSGSLTQSVDQSMPYGQDPAYQNAADNTMSGGSVHQFTVTDDSVFASFTFTGTGFEIISRTDTAFGVMVATVYATDAEGNATGDPIRTLPVVTEFDNSKNDEFGGEIIYQVPILRVENLSATGEPATYVVKLSGVPQLDTDINGDGQPDAPTPENEVFKTWCTSGGLTYETILSLVNPEEDKWIQHTQIKTWYDDGLLNEKEYAHLEEKDAAGNRYDRDALLNRLVSLLHPPKAEAKAYTLWIDGLRIFQPLGKTHAAYNAAEQGATFEEVRNLLLDQKLAYILRQNTESDFQVCTGNLIWTENRNGVNSEGATYQHTLVDSINDYVVSGPNNELYFYRTSTNFQVLLFYVQEDELDTTTGSLQVGVRFVDYQLFQDEAGTVEMPTLRYVKENGETDVEEVVAEINSSTEQYYSINYTSCPYTMVDGKKVYTVMVLARTGMASFTGLKHNGLVIQNVVDIPATDDNGLPTGDQLMTGAEWYYNSDGTLVTETAGATASSPSVHFDMRALSHTMDQIMAAPQTPEALPEPPETPDETVPGNAVVQPLTGTVNQTPAKEMPSALLICLLTAGVLAVLVAAWLLTKKYLRYL